jgi:transcriptional regulator with XRE-family HTH domain
MEGHMASEVASVRDFLKSHREDSGLSLAVFAKRLGVSESAVLKIESGKMEAPPKYIDVVIAVSASEQNK